jgi:hypothetical protein
LRHDVGNLLPEAVASLLLRWKLGDEAKCGISLSLTLEEATSVVAKPTDGMRRAGPRRDALSSQVIDALAAHEIRRPAMKKPSTMTGRRNGQLTIGLDVGDRSSFYRVLNETGEVILEARVATSPEVMKKTFGKMPRSRIR